MQLSCPSFLLLLLLPVLPVFPWSQITAPPAANPVSLSLGPSVIALNGPWKFHTGDNPRWAAPTFDDSDWETVDLTPPPDSHDADVGLTGYVPGWTTKGHPAYSGYAWYRMSVAITASPGETLALAGPPDVDDAYQLFFNGRLSGSAGTFSAATPVVYSIRPRIFPLPKLSAATSAENIATIAFRVWMDSSSLADSPDSGGIHIAPALGLTSAIDARYRLQWMQTFWGYVVEALLPVLFALLAIMACALIPFDPSDSTYLWLAVALLLIALIRFNQVLFFWFQFESVHTADFALNVFLVPLNLAAWTMAWRCWFQLRTPWIPKAVAALTLLYMAAQFLTRPSLHFAFSHPVSAASHFVSTCVRLLFIPLLIFIVYLGIRQRARDRWLALPAVLLISIGLFAQEVSAMHIPGIWFPYGVGVSRTQFACAAFCIVLFALMLRRLLSFAPRASHLAPESKSAETLSDTRREMST
jgi:hypothetical protein